MPIFAFLRFPSQKKKYDSYVRKAIASQTPVVSVKFSVADSVNKRPRGYLCLLASFYVPDHEVIFSLHPCRWHHVQSRPTNRNSPLSFPLRSGTVAAKESIWWGPAPLVNFRTDPPPAIPTKRQVDLCVRHRGGTDRVSLLLMCCFSLSLSFSPITPSNFSTKLSLKLVSTIMPCMSRI